MNTAKSDLEKAAGNFKSLSRLVSRSGLHLAKTSKRFLQNREKTSSKETIKKELDFDRKSREIQNGLENIEKPKYKDLEIHCCMDYISYFKTQTAMKDHVYDVSKEKDLIYFKTNLQGYCSINNQISEKAKERFLSSIQLISKTETQISYPGLKELQSEISQHPNVKLINDRNREISRIYLNGLQTMLEHPKIMDQFKQLQEYFEKEGSKVFEKGEKEYTR